MLFLYCFNWFNNKFKYCRKLFVLYPSIPLSKTHILAYIVEFIWWTRDESSGNNFGPGFEEFLFWTLESLRPADVDIINPSRSAESWYQLIINLITQWADQSGHTQARDNLINLAKSFAGGVQIKAKYAIITTLCNDDCAESEIGNDLFYADIRPTLSNKYEPGDFLALLGGWFAGAGLIPPSEEALIEIFIEAFRPRVKPPCPSAQCWSYDAATKKCTPIEGSGCWELKCGPTEVELSFDSALFDVVDNDNPDKFAECPPVWDATIGRWVWKKTLGECMNAFCTE